VSSYREELAWAGGLFEGEGSASIRGEHRVGKGGPSLRIGVAMCDLGPLERFQRAIGGLGIIYGPYSPPSRHPDWRPIFHWRAERFEHAQAVIAMLWPWLDSRRRGQCKAALDAVRRPGPSFVQEEWC
jgi:hypothetical protein